MLTSSLKPSKWSERLNQVYIPDYTRSTKNYVETKVGGHRLDHRVVFQKQPLSLSLHVRPCDQLSQRSYLPYGIQLVERREYSPTKVGGHALDHVRFLGKGKPSRLLLNCHSNFIQRPIKLYRSLYSLVYCMGCLNLYPDTLISLRCQHRYCENCFYQLKRVVKGKILHAACTACLNWVPLPLLVPELIDSSPPRMMGNLADASLDEEMLDAMYRRDAEQATNIDFSTQFKWASAYATAFSLAPRVVHRIEKLIQACRKPRTLTLPSAANGFDVHAFDSVEVMDDWNERIALVQRPSKLLRYDFVQQLGSGNFAKIFLMKRKGQYCVLKESDKIPELINEVNLLQRVRHPHVLKIGDFFVEKIGHQTFGYIEAEYCENGDLKSYIEKQGPLDEAKLVPILKQLCKGLAAVHKHKIIHRDITPSNILLTREMSVKIADLGVSTILGTASKTIHPAGTLAFMVPEVREYYRTGGGEIEYDTRVDIWSLGAIAVALITGNASPNIVGRELDEVLESLLSRNINSTLARIIYGALLPNPSERATLDQFITVLSTTLNARL